jgi:acetoin utilization deacetylase AcuC-like enzyme
MDKLVYYYSEGHHAHYQLNHYENPERFDAIRQGLCEIGCWENFPHLQPLDLPASVLYAVHNPDYVERYRLACQKGEALDQDTYTTPFSFDLSLKAGAGTAAVASAVWRGEAERGYSLARPPGHHASSNRGSGFCLFNNIALAAEYLCQQEGAQRLAILDLDLHHGNGTQDIFWRRNDVFFISLHQSPLYPGSGRLEDIGAGPGKGFTANLPLPPASGDYACLGMFIDLALPLLASYAPEMLLVSLGFDPHWCDPLGHLRMSAAGFGEVISVLDLWAKEYCQGKLLLVQEGGYHLDAAKACAQATVTSLLNIRWKDPIGPCPRPEGKSWRAVLRDARKIWKL